jgi:hypothetical protein
MLSWFLTNVARIATLSGLTSVLVTTTDHQPLQQTTPTPTKCVISAQHGQTLQIWYDP